MQTLFQSVTRLDALKSLELASQDLNLCCFKSRCSAYPGLPSVETFVKLNLRSSILPHVSITLSTGKYLSAKLTLVSVKNYQGDTLSFGFHDNKITYSINGVKNEIDCTPKGSAQAYENVFESLYLGDYSMFIKSDVAMEALRIITPVLSQSIPLFEYEPNCNPLS